MNVAIIVPVFNAEPYLDRLVNSVFSNETSIYLILVDDCSSDNSYQKILDIQKSNPNVIIGQNSSNSGVGHTRNQGIKKIPVDTDYVYFLDADDWLVPNSIDLMVKHVKRNYSSVVLGQLRCFDGNEFFSHKYNQLYFSTDLNIFDLSKFPELILCPTLSNRLIDVSLIDKLEFFEDRYFAEDFHFSLRTILDADHIAIVGKPVVNIQDLGQQVDNASLWNTSNPERAWNTLRSSDNMLSYISQRDNNAFYKCILFHSIYRMPRNIIYMCGKQNETNKYFSAVNDWLLKLDVDQIPLQLKTNATCFSASVYANYVLTLLLEKNNKQLARFYCSSKAKQRSELIEFFKLLSIRTWNISSKSDTLKGDFLPSERDNRHIKGSVYSRLKQLRFYYKIKKSGLFDRNFYTKHNDVHWIGKFFPLIHYLLVGGFMGFKGSKKLVVFDYERLRPDVIRAGVNPLGHFVTSGILEM